MPAISVIVLTYDGVKWIIGCLDALAAQVNAPSFETIVVDNGSSDGTADVVRSKYPSVKVIELTNNVGFAGGNNAGARAASGEWLAFLNNDTIPDRDWLEHLAAAATRPEYALITSCLVFLDDPSRVDSAGDGYLRAGGAFKHGHGRPVAAFSSSREVFGACGGAFMIRRAAFDELMGFDERLFAVYEDVDLSYRARLLGFRTWYAADALVRHAGGGTMGAVSRTVVFYGQRNLEWVWIRNTPAPLLLKTALSHLCYSAAGVAHYVRLGLAGTVLRAKWAALRELPAVIAERRRVQAGRRVASREIERVMDGAWLAAKRREKAFAATRVSEP